MKTYNKDNLRTKDDFRGLMMSVLEPLIDVVPLLDFRTCVFLVHVFPTYYNFLLYHIIPIIIFI